MAVDSGGRRRQQHHDHRRNAAGEATAIVGPYGQRTTLTVDSNGYLAEIRDPAGESLHFIYGSGGLLAEMTDARATGRSTPTMLGAAREG